jgi:hypothetical protein
VVGFEMAKNRKYRLTEEYTLAALEKFAGSLVEGTLEAEFKSAPVPEDNKDADVTVVVGKSFEDLVLDPTKDVLLEVSRAGGGVACCPVLRRGAVSLSTHAPPSLDPPPHPRPPAPSAARRCTPRGAATASSWTPSTRSWPSASRRLTQS